MATETHNADPPEKRRFCGVKGRSGAPKENRNALRHGLKGGNLPKDAKYIQHRLNGFRRQLEDHVLELRGEVSIVEAATIQTILRWERHASLALRWLNKSADSLTAMERLHFSREIARASTERDKSLRELKLDKEPEIVDLKTYVTKAVE